MENTNNQSVRVKAIREDLGFTQGQFAQIVGLKQGSYSDIERGKNNLSYNVLAIIAENYNVNINWLLTGKGSMYVSTQNSLEVAKPSNNISLMDISVAAGTISDTDIAGQVVETFSLPNLRGTGYYALYVDGDSMTPTYHHGDLVVVKRIDNASFKSDEVYLVNLRGSLPVLKRVRRLSQTNFELHSDNPSIGPYNIEVDSIADFFRVYSVIRHK
mgnify:CR=1 FL=1